MSRHLLVLAACAISMGSLGVGTAYATHPILGFEAELVPELSSVAVTGGIAGIHETYQVEGVLSLFVDWHPHPPDTVQAGFATVDATLEGEGFFDGVALDDLLRMTQWQGVIIDEETLSFIGVDGQEAPITSVADFPSAWLRLRGSNFPGCCDFFNYSWDLFALNRITEHGHAHADFDEDGDVDGDDLLDALIHFGEGNDVTHLHGDADADGDVDRTDVTIWKSTFGRGLEAYPTASSAALPEPATWQLVIVLLLVLVQRRPHWRGRAQHEFI